MYATTPFRSLSSPSSPLPVRTKSTPLSSSFDRVGVVSSSNSKISPFFKLGLDSEPNWVIRASSSSASLTRSKYVEGEEGLESSCSSSSPVSVELEQILNESHFDRLLADAQHHDSLVILWMASWCRKCIYLKPKLEKLAAEYYPRIRFYCIDVNNIPHKLVVRAGVAKMPTIQVWKDSKKQAEMIGGHKPYLVVNEVREMIENEDPNV